MNSLKTVSKLLTPVVPASKGVKGMLPHHKYRLIRTKAEEIIRLRDDLHWSNNRAGRSLGFRSAAEYDQAYLLLKANAEKLVMEGDWSGVEKVIYQRFDNFQADQKFRDLLRDLGDPRMMPGGSLVDAPVEPARPPALPLVPVIPPAPTATPAPASEPTVPSPGSHALSEPASTVDVKPPTIIRRFGKSTVRDPIVVAEEAQATPPKN